MGSIKGARVFMALLLAVSQVVMLGGTIFAIGGDATPYYAHTIFPNPNNGGAHYNSGRDGKKYYINDGNASVYRIDNGNPTLIAGNPGQSAFSPDGSPAVGSSMMPTWVTADANGTVYISEAFYGRVRKILPDGSLITVAGNGQTSGQRVNQAPDATQTPFVNPWTLAIGPDGLLYIQDSYDSQGSEGAIRRINADGSTNTVVGDFDVNSTPYVEGARADEHRAPFEGSVTHIDFDSNGQLFFTNTGTIFKVDSAGYITRYAGNGGQGAGSDYDVYRLNLSTDQIGGIAFDSQDNLFYIQYVAPWASVVRISSITGNARQFMRDGSADPWYSGSAKGLALNWGKDLFIDNADTMTFLSEYYPVLREVVLDTIKPTIYSTVNPSANINGWSNSNTTVGFVCGDQETGIGYCTNSHPDPFTDDGIYTVTGQATDKAGNTKSLNVEIKLDKTAPQVLNAKMGSTLLLLNHTTTIQASVSDSLSGIGRIEYYIDNDPGVGSGSQLTNNNGSVNNTVTISSTAGSHKLYVRVVDMAGNITLSPALSFIYV